MVTQRATDEALALILKEIWLAIEFGSLAEDWSWLFEIARVLEGWALIRMKEEECYNNNGGEVK